MAKKFVILTLLLSLISSVYAEEKSDLLGSGGQDFLIVVGCGLAGGILGLSTLSFVEEPGDHLNNVVVGGAIGLIVGVAAVAWGQASKSHEQFMDTTSSDFGTKRRYQWHNRQKLQVMADNGYTPADFSYSFKF